MLDLDLKVVGWQSGQKAQITVIKRFTRDDLTGAFDIKLQIHLLFADGTERFDWVIQGGSGAYQRLRGSGSGATIDPSELGNTNIYDGFVIN